MSYTPDDLSRTVVERHDPMLGTIVGGRFRIEQRLAAGGFGAVYRAREVSTNQEFAVKVLHPMHARDPQLVQRFRREGATLASLMNTHTVTTYEVGEDADGTLYIVMELLHGETLHDRVAREGRLPWRQAIAIVRAVCDSLIEAHELGIVHRDLKPANIHLEPRDGGEHVKVLDFGIAKIQRGSGIDDGAELTAHGQMIGTFDYMSPEQIVGGAFSGRSDIYTLGIVMCEMLTGQRPFGAATGPALLASVLTDTPPPPSSRAPACFPPEIDGVVLRCLAREPQDRYGSVAELASVLDLLLGPVVEGPTMRLVVSCDEATIIQPRSSAPMIRAARGSSPPVRGDAPTEEMTAARPVANTPPYRAVYPAGAFRIQPAQSELSVYPTLDGWAAPPEPPRSAVPPRSSSPSFEIGSSLARDQLARRVTWIAILVVGLVLVVVLASIL